MLIGQSIKNKLNNHYFSLSWRSIESTRLPPIRRLMWAEFVGSLILLREVFLRVLRFSPLRKKPTFLPQAYSFKIVNRV